MTKEQIEIYEYCKKYLGKLATYKEKLPFKSQEFGCGSSRPKIEFELENIHKDIYAQISKAMADANTKVEKIIEDL